MAEKVVYCIDSTDTSSSEEEQPQTSGEIKLTKVEKSLILRLFVTESFIDRNLRSCKEYRCSEKCEFCDSKLSTSPTANMLSFNFQEHEEDFSLGKEKRLRVIKSLIHDHFEAKWNFLKKRAEELDEKIKAQIAQVKDDVPAVAAKDDIPAVRNETEVAPVSESNDSNDSVVFVSSTPGTVSKKRKVNTPANESESASEPCPVKNVAEKQPEKKQKVINEDKDNGNTSEAIEKNVELALKQISREVQFSPQHNRNNFVAKIRPERNKVEKVTCGNQNSSDNTSRRVRQMDNTSGAFFIDKEDVDVNSYQNGLRHDRWNPTQCVYELCSCCSWGTPIFCQEDYRFGDGYIFSVTIKEQKFFSLYRFKTKKEAKHLASVRFLQYLGFRFSYYPKPPGGTSLFEESAQEVTPSRIEMPMHSMYEPGRSRFPYRAHMRPNTGFFKPPRFFHT